MPAKPLPILGRHVDHDERSRNFPAKTAASLHSVNHRHTGAVLDQGQLGSCTCNALVDALMTTPQRRVGRTLTEDNAVELYKLATTLDNVPGSYPPDDTGSTGLAACKAGQQRGYVKSYAHAFGLDHVLAALVLGPVMIGIDWTQDMFTPNKNGFIRPTGAIAGGHEVCLVGLNVPGQYVTLLNSWGLSWGRAGRAHLTFADLGQLLSQQGDATVPQSV